MKNLIQYNIIILVVTFCISLSYYVGLLKIETQYDNPNTISKMFQQTTRYIIGIEIINIGTMLLLYGYERNDMLAQFIFIIIGIGSFVANSSIMVIPIVCLIHFPQLGIFIWIMHLTVSVIQYFSILYLFAL